MSKPLYQSPSGWQYYRQGSQPHAYNPDEYWQVLGAERDFSIQNGQLYFAERSHPQVILATNVAETSLTIEGVKVVVDSLKRRDVHYNVKSGVTTLVTQSVSRASAIQRAGRAGRLSDGFAYRLAEKSHFERLDAHDTPEILKSDISQFALEAAIWGAKLDELPLLDTPSKAQQAAAHACLTRLGLIDDKAKVTAKGRKVHHYSGDFRLGHLLYQLKDAQPARAHHQALVHNAIAVCALLDSGERVRGDMFIALNSLLKKPTPSLKDAIKRYEKQLASRLSLDALSRPLMALALALVFPERVAKRRELAQKVALTLASGSGGELASHCRDDFTSEYLVVFDLDGETAHSAIECDMSLLSDYLPGWFSERHECHFDEKTERFINHEITRFGDVIMSEQPSSKPIDDTLKAEAWLSLFKQHGFSLFTAAKLPALLARLNLASSLWPEDFGELAEVSLLNDNAWLHPYLSQVGSYKALLMLDVPRILLDRLGFERKQMLNERLPSHFQPPEGAAVAIEYQTNGPAKIALKLQRLFGVTQTPVLGLGKVPLQISLLSPAGRPLQITQDLAHFWQTSYFDVQKEMKGRYPKHPWPDDPANAKPTSKTKARM